MAKGEKKLRNVAWHRSNVDNPMDGVISYWGTFSSSLLNLAVVGNVVADYYAAFRCPTILT